MTPTRPTPSTLHGVVRTLAATALLAAAVGLSACASTGTGTTETMTTADQRQLEAASGGAPVVAVAMVADWCGPCKKLEPKFNEAMTTLPYNSVRVIHADYTDRRNPEALATLRDAGLASLEASNNGTTGVIYLIDADSGRVLGDIRGAGPTASEIRQRLTDAIAAAS